MAYTEKRDPKTGQFLKGNKSAKKHGAFAEKKTYPERLRRLVRHAKAGWVRDIGPGRKDLTTSQRILIDKAAFILSRTLTIEIWLEDHPEDYARMLAKGLRDTYLAWCNTLRLTLRELGIDKRQGPKGMTEKEYLQSIEYPEDEKPTDKEAPE